MLSLYLTRLIRKVKAENKLYIVKSQEGTYSYSAQIKSVPDDSFKYARTTVVNINKYYNLPLFYHVHRPIVPSTGL